MEESTVSREEIISNLRKEIERTDAQTEKECGVLLEQIAWVLLSVADGNTTFVSSEQTVTSGRIDIVVLAESQQVGGFQRREAYVWELKAPQLEIFETKTKSLAQPSQHLYGAETQLLHYYYSIINNPMLLKRWGIISSDYVKFGGVIIGRDKNFVNHKLKDLDAALGEILAKEAHDIREKYIYRHLNIKLWTWDNIIYLAESKSLSNQKITGDPNTTIELTGSVDLKATITPVDWAIGEE